MQPKKGERLAQNWISTCFGDLPHGPSILSPASSTSKPLSEALIFASTNPQYDDRLFIELQVQYMKITSSNLGRTCCVQTLFLTFRTVFVHNMFSPCSVKRRDSDKDLPVQVNSTPLVLILLRTWKKIRK